MFTVEQRDALRDRVLALAHDDARIVAGAAVGSLALGDGDRYSDLDLTFAVSAGASVTEVLDEWTRTLRDEVMAVPLVDLVNRSTTYRVLLLPGPLQLDLSMTPADQFVAAGPKFRLLFGETAGPGRSPGTPNASDVFGWGVIYALHSRACIERGRLWQAEHYIGAVRDHALTLACVAAGLPAHQARGYDDLASEVLRRFDDTHVGSLTPERLRTTLAAATRALLYEGRDVPNADEIAPRLSELT